MRLRPVEPKDAAAIDAINALIPEGEYLSLSVKDRSDAADMISRLTPFDHMFVFETEDETPEICAIVLLRVNHQIYLRAETPGKGLRQDPNRRSAEVRKRRVDDGARRGRDPDR